MFEINFSQFHDYINDLVYRLSETASTDNNPIFKILLDEFIGLKTSSVYCVPHHLEDYTSEVAFDKDNTFTIPTSRIFVFEREYYKTDNKYLFYRFIEPNIVLFLDKNSKTLEQIKLFFNLDSNIEYITICIRKTDDGKWHIPLYINSVEFEDNIQLKNFFILKDEISILKTAITSNSFQSLIKNGIQENTNLTKNILISSLSIGTDWIANQIENNIIWIPDYFIRPSKVLTASEENKRKEKDSSIKVELDKMNRFDLKV